MHRLTTRWGLTGALIANRSVVVPHTRKELAHGPVSGKGNYGDLVREKGGDVTVCPIREFLLFALPNPIRSSTSSIKTRTRTRTL